MILLTVESKKQMNKHNKTETELEIQRTETGGYQKRGTWGEG